MGSDQIADRLKLVCDKVYAKNITKMASDLGIDRATCSRYLSNDRPPRRQTLMVLSQRQRISLDWLENGGGDEIQFEGESSLSAIVECGLPVLRIPSEMTPTPSTPGQTGMLLAAPPTLYKADRYWLRVPRDLTEQLIKEGDHLLIEVHAPRAVGEGDIGHVLVLKKPEGVEFSLVTKDMVKHRTQVQVVGTPLLLHREL